MIPDSPRVMVAIAAPAARAFLADNLRADRHDAIVTTNIQHAECRLSDRVDALIVGLGVDTLALIDYLRESAAPSCDPDLPVLALTDVKDRFHAIRLLDRGADAVLRESWSYIELRAQLSALLRRAARRSEPRLLTAGELTVDPNEHRVWIGPGEINSLPAKEFNCSGPSPQNPGASSPAPSCWRRYGISASGREPERWTRTPRVCGGGCATAAVTGS